MKKPLNKERISTLGRLLHLVKPYPLIVIASLTALAAATGAEVASPLVMQRLLDRFILNEALPQAERIAGILPGIFIFAILLLANLAGSFLQIYLTTRLSQTVMKDLRMKLFSHLLSQKLSFLEKTPVGTLVSRVTSDVETVNEFFTSVASALLKDLALMAGVLAALFVLDPRLAAITLLTLPPVAALTLFFRVRARRAFRRLREEVSRLNRYLSEHISGMEVVQMFGREEGSREEFDQVNRGWKEASLGQMYTFAVFRPLVDWLSTFSIAVILFAGASALDNRLVTLGVLIAFINLIQKFYTPIKDLSEKFNLLQSALAGGERVFDLLDEDHRIPDTTGTSPSKEEKMETKSDASSPSHRGGILFEGVDFSYTPGQPILKDLSFAIQPGETVAVVGYTGAGKTTIASLLTRLWDIQGGRILLDGRDVREYPLARLRRTVQPVAQDVFLFSGTIRDNITLGDSFDDAAVLRAAETVQAHSFIESLPQGYDTPVNEGGANLSTGQRQLLSFARVLLHNPAVIILDEATSSIDTRTEGLIQTAMDRLLSDRTSLVIAHRLSTIRHADRILVLHQGRLAESGSHEELMAQGGRYKILYHLQYAQNKTDKKGSLGQKK